MQTMTATIIPFPNFCMHAAFLKHMKEIVKDSKNDYEQTAFAVASELEEMLEQETISWGEFAVTVGKAMDVLCYFRYDADTLAKDNSWYRTGIIHQMCCGMLQTLHQLRPDVYATMLRESAYDLYFRPTYSKKNNEMRPLTCKTW